MLLLFFKMFLVVIIPQASFGQNESYAELQVKPSFSFYWAEMQRDTTWVIITWKKKKNQVCPFAFVA